MTLLQPEGDVADVVVPVVILVPELHGTSTSSWPLLPKVCSWMTCVSKPGAPLALAAVEMTELVFGEGFFGDDGARQVEFAARPVGSGAEGAQVGDDVVDLVVDEQISRTRA